MPEQKGKEASNGGKAGRRREELTGTTHAVSDGKKTIAPGSDFVLYLSHPSKSKLSFKVLPQKQTCFTPSVTKEYCDATEAL
jgi:hypothetical protein